MPRPVTVQASTRSPEKNGIFVAEQAAPACAVMWHVRLVHFIIVMSDTKVYEP